MPRAMCHMSHVTYHMSHVFSFYLGQSGETSCGVSVINGATLSSFNRPCVAGAVLQTPS